MYLYYICRELVYFLSFSANGAAHEERYTVCGYQIRISGSFLK